MRKIGVARSVRLKQDGVVAKCYSKPAWVARLIAWRICSRVGKLVDGIAYEHEQRKTIPYTSSIYVYLTLPLCLLNAYRRCLIT